MFNLLRELSGILGRDAQNQKDTNWTTIEDALNNLQAQIIQLVVHGDSSPQAAAASVGYDGTDYGGDLKARLDAEFNLLKAWVNTYGLGSISKSISSTDLNALPAEDGFYRGNNLTHAPNDDTGYFHIIVLAHSSSYITQFALRYGSGSTGAGREYRRQLNAGVWGAWEEVVHLSNAGLLTVPSQPCYSIQYGAGTQAMAAAVDCLLAFDGYNTLTKDFASGVFTAPEDGTYQFQCIASISGPLGSNLEIHIYKNGSFVKALSRVRNTAYDNYPYIINGSSNELLSAGDKIKLYAYSNLDSTLNKADTWVNVAKLS